MAIVDWLAKKAKGAKSMERDGVLGSGGGKRRGEGRCRQMRPELWRDSEGRHEGRGIG